LYDDYQASVPHIVAVNPDLHVFLMEDAGLPLLQFEDTFQRKAIEQYQRIQQQSEKDISAWLEMDVPDWRLEKLPDLYAAFIQNKDFLMQQGVEDIETLTQRQTLLKQLCETLAQHNISSTLDHCDFHEKNVLVHPSTHQVSIIDWPETVITHPYFSWINYVRKSSRGSEDLFSPQSHCRIFKRMVRHSIVMTV
jgi:hypothetical protein